MKSGNINKYARIVSAGCLVWDNCIEKNFGCFGKECIFYEAPNEKKTHLHRYEQNYRHLEKY